MCVVSACVFSHQVVSEPWFVYTLEIRSAEINRRDVKIAAVAFASLVTEHINMILARLTSVGIKFDDEVQALLLLLSLPDSWSRTVTVVTSSADLIDSLLRRFVISFLARMSKEGVLGNYLVNRYMSSEERNIRDSGSKNKRKSQSKTRDCSSVTCWN